MALDTRYENVRITGFDHIQSVLKDLPDAANRRVLTGALRGAAAEVRTAVRANTPRDTGNLRKSIGVEVLNTRDARRRTVRVGARTTRRGSGRSAKNDGFYARFLEFGTKYIPARPFIAPAFRSVRDRIVERIGEELVARVEKEVEKLSRSKPQPNPRRPGRGRRR